MANLGEIEKLTKVFVGARELLIMDVHEMENELNEIKMKYLPVIKKSVAAAKEKIEKLRLAIKESPELFEKPRSFILYGVKVGYQKGKGAIEWDDDEQVVKLIEKHFPEQADVLIKTTKKPVKKSLSQLTVAELKRLGIVVEETGDQVIIKPVDSEVDKLVEALLKDETKEGLKEAA